MDKRELIIREASLLFFEKGYYGVGLNELLTRCDIPKGSFYYYFPKGKKQLLQEVIQAASAHLMNAMANRILIKENALDSFRNMVTHLASRVEERRFVGSLLLTILSVESVYLDEETHALCKQVYHDWHQLYVDKLIGYGYPEEVAKRKAQTLFALIHGTHISSYIKQDKQDFQYIYDELEYILK